jgi:hypothetical protein
MNSYIDDLTQKKHIHNAHIHILVSVSIFKSSGQHYIYFIIERFVVLLRCCWGRSVDFDCDGIYSLNVRLMLKYILDHFIERSHCHIFLDFIFLIVTERGVSTYRRHWIYYISCTEYINNVTSTISSDFIL